MKEDFEGSKDKKIDFNTQTTQNFQKKPEQ